MTLHFIRPYWLWMILPAILYLIWLIYSFKQHNPWKKVCDPHLLQELMQSSASKSHLFLYFLLLSFYVIGIFALAGPAWKKTALPIYKTASSLMLVLDLSQIMNTTDLKPNRMTRAKYKIRDLINTAQNTQMGLVVFTEESFVVSPLSQDASTLHTLLDELNPEIMPVSGSDSGQGLKEGYQLLKQGAASNGHLLLITASHPTANSWSAAKTIFQSGAHLNVLGILENSSDNQSTITNLKELAKTGGGTFYLFTKDTSDIQAILASLEKKQVTKVQNITHVYEWQDAGPWFCLLLIPIVLYVFRKHAV